MDIEEHLMILMLDFIYLYKVTVIFNDIKWPVKKFTVNLRFPLKYFIIIIIH